MEPKAKWTRRGNAWTAVVGPFHLMVTPKNGGCEICDSDTSTSPVTAGALVWDNRDNPLPTPCDVTDLMRMTEAELARRLTGAAETMRGEGLVATECVAMIPPPAMGKTRTFDPQPARAAAKPAPTSPKPLKVGDRVSVYCYTAAKRVLGTVTHYDSANHRYTVDNDLGMWGVFDADNVEPAQPRFKVGDLVRIDRKRPVIGGVAELPARGDRWFGVNTGLKHLVYAAAEELTTYTLPPIASYADLADVLDELPQGVVVEMREVGCYPVMVRRAPDGYEARYTHVSVPWSASRLIDHGNTEPRNIASRIVPASEVGE